MQSFADIRSQTHRLCSDFAAELLSFPAFGFAAVELLRQRAGCRDAALWISVGTSGKRALRRLVRGEPHAHERFRVSQASVPLKSLPRYLEALRTAGSLLCRSPGDTDPSHAQACLLHPRLTGSLLHIPIFYNGEIRGLVCLSDPDPLAPWPCALRRELKQLVTLVTTYVLPRDTRRTGKRLSFPGHAARWPTEQHSQAPEHLTSTKARLRFNGIESAGQA